MALSDHGNVRASSLRTSNRSRRGRSIPTLRHPQLRPLVVVVVTNEPLPFPTSPHDTISIFTACIPWRVDFQTLNPLDFFDLVTLQLWLTRILSPLPRGC